MVAIETFSHPATDLIYPAITVCNRHKYDVGEYIRAVFDNFELRCSSAIPGDCNKTAAMREDFGKYATMHSVINKCSKGELRGL